MAARPRRIVHVITRLELGGAQQNTLYCVEHHDRSRYRVALVAGQGGILDDDARRIPDAEIALVPWLRHPIAPLRDLEAVLRLRRWLREREIDLVHTHSSKAGVVGRAAAALAGVPAVVHTVHGWSFNRTQPRGTRALYVLLERIAAAATDRWIVVADADRREGLRRGIGRAERYVLLRSGIDPAGFAAPAAARESIRAALGFAPGDVVVGTLSSMKPQKAPLDFVRAAGAAHAADPRLRFFFAGDGALRPDVEREIERLRLQPVVKLLGWRRDVAELLRAADLFVLTSLFEGLPRAVLQAMAAGVPVIATAVDGTPEVVADGVSGRLVPPARPDLVAGALVEMASDAALRARCVAGGRAALGASFDIRRMLAGIEGVYAELLGHPPRAGGAGGQRGGAGQSSLS